MNQYTEYVDNNGDFVWESTSDFVPSQSTSYGTIAIGKSMSMSFDMVWNSHTSSDADSSEWFFRIGANASEGGNGCYGNLNRYPALSITTQNTLAIHLSNEEACSAHYDIGHPSGGAVSY